MKKSSWFSLLILIVFLSIFNIPTSQEQGSRRVFMWWQTTEYTPTFTSAEIGTWAKDLGVTNFAIYPDLAAADRTYLQTTLSLKLFQVYITPTTTNLMNWTDYVITMTGYADAAGYDGIIFDDTQLVWYQAQENGTVDDLTWFQFFVNNVTDYAVPTFGSDNVIVEMAAWSDTVDYDTDMPHVNATDVTFSYYYPPDPELKYFTAYTDTSFNAWDIKGYYDTVGLNSYYKYQGWLWLEGSWSSNSLTTYSLISTYNAVVTLADSYTVDDLQIYNVYQLYWNHRGIVTPFLKEIITAWKADETLSTSKIRLQNYPELLWSEDFSGGINNQTEISVDDWQVVKTGANNNYSYTTSGKYLTILHSGTHSSGYSNLEFKRLIGSPEFGFSINAKITPVNQTSDKQFIIEGIYPYPYAYRFAFEHGTSRNMTFTYKNASYVDDQTIIANWTLNSEYAIGFTFNETYAYAIIANSTFSWNYTIPQNLLMYSSMKLYSIFYADTIGGFASASTEFTSAILDDINIIPTHNSYSFESYETGTEIKGTFAQNTTIYFYFSGYPIPINVTGVENLDYFGATNPNLNDTLTFDAVEDIEFRIYWTEYAFWIPFEFIMGIFGLVGMIGFPMFMISKAKKKEFSDMGWMFAGACISAALFFAWLWLA